MKWIKRIGIGLLTVLVLFAIIGTYGFNRLGKKIYGGLTERVDDTAFTPQTGPVLIRGAYVLSPEGDSFRTGPAVLIENGLIQVLDSAATVPPRMTILDGSGRYLIPGLTDAHVHLFQSRNDLLLYLANGVTQVRELIGEPDHLTWRDQIAVGERIGPRLFVASPRLGSFGPTEGRLMEMTQGYRNVPDAAAGEALVREMHTKGYDGIKVYSQLNRESYLAITRTARELGLPTFGHIPFAVSLEDIWQNGQRGIAHLEELMNALQREFGQYKGDNIQKQFGSFRGREEEFLAYVTERSADLAAQLRASDITVTTTLWLTQSFVHQKFALDSVLSEVELAYANPGISEWVSFIPNGLGWLPAVNRYRLPGDLDAAARAGQRRYWLAYGEACKILANRLAQAGVPLMAGTDANLPPAVPGFSLHDELVSLQAAGLSPARVLRSATATPAEWLGRKAGKIATGYAADLVLLEENPLEDIAHTRKINTVIAAGRVFDRDTLDRMLAAVRAANDTSRTVAIAAWK